MTSANRVTGGIVATARLVFGLALAPGLGLGAGIGVAQASDTGPVIVIPGHPDVPVIINGRDASYGVVVGDWGLARPGAIPVQVYGPPAALRPDGRGYYPFTGRQPRYGRVEYEPARRVLPPPAPTYRRSWSAGPGPEPATVSPSYQAPDVTIAPRERRR